jgi:hypothetical protein
MKVKEAQTLKLGTTLKMRVLMSKNTFSLEGILRKIDYNPDPSLYIEVTDYYNSIYPKDEAYKIGNVQQVHLRKIRSFDVIESE